MSPALLSTVSTGALIAQLAIASAEVPTQRFSDAQQHCRVSIHPLASLGSVDDPASVQIPVEAYVAAVPWGGWVVAEDANDVIHYNQDGQFQGIVARRGEGPGELRSPNSVVVDPTDSTWISDQRGRAVIFGPDGRAGRTLLAPELLQIEGFTESGLPYAMLTKVDQSRPAAVQAWRFIRIWDREGAHHADLGPAHFAPGAEGLIVNEVQALQGVLDGDTLGIVPSDWRFWLTYWSAAREWGRVPADSVWDALELDGSPGSYEDGRPEAISEDPEGGY